MQWVRGFRFDRPASVEAINGLLSLFLGVLGAILATVAIVNDSFVMGGLAAAVSVALGVVAVWQSMLRRSAEAELNASRREVEQLQARIEVHDQKLDTTRTRAITARERANENRLDAVDPRGLNDPETGLLGEDYFLLAMHARVAYGRRHLRPVSLILFDVVEGVGADSQPTPAHPTEVAEIIATTLRDADTVCRLRHGRFGVILEDTNETGAIWTVERIRRELNTDFVGLTVWAGVACYPAHGFDGQEIFHKATVAIEAARDWFQDRTEVAT